jgi:hypothetical protein
MRSCTTAGMSVWAIRSYALAWMATNGAAPAATATHRHAHDTHQRPPRRWSAAIHSDHERTRRTWHCRRRSGRGVRGLHLCLARRRRQSSRHSERRTGSPRVHPRPGRRGARSWSGGSVRGQRRRRHPEPLLRSHRTNAKPSRDLEGPGRSLRPGSPRRADGADLQRAELPAEK